jgi:hypothetical protein
VQLIKLSRLSSEEQKRWIEELAAIKFEPTKPFRSGDARRLKIDNINGLPD